jgi:ATP-dependent RNA helicase CshB
MIKKTYLQRAIDDLKFESFTEIQNKVIPPALNQEDIVGCSNTGSGKTHAFLIPLFERLEESKKQLQVILMVPTKELVVQLKLTIDHIVSFSEEDIQVQALTRSTKDQAQDRQTEPQILIGTPQSLVNLLLEERMYSLKHVKQVILDEADILFEPDFIETSMSVIESLPNSVQKLVFSATITQDLNAFFKSYLTNPKRFMLDQTNLLNIEHIFISVQSKTRSNVFKQLIDSINPFVCLVFCSKKEDVEYVANIVKDKTQSVAILHGDLEKRERNRIIKQAKRGDFQYLVTTDILSRGIDIDGVSHVINFDLPDNKIFYIHRTGRTGRASYDGIAYSLYGDHELDYIPYLLDHQIEVSYYVFTKDGLKEKKKRSSRVKRDHRPQEHLNIKKNNKKVKPGYKKKYNKELKEKMKKNWRKK